MEQFKYFTKEDTEIIRLNLGILSGLKNLEDRLITGFNYYYQAINPNKLIISLSFLHRSEDIRDKFIEDLVSEDNTKILLSSERTKEIPFFREKRSIYLGRPNFRIAKDPLTKESDPNVYYFDFISGEEVQTEILRRANYIDDILKLCSKYKQIGNAVPVNLGYYIGDTIIKMLNGEIEEEVEMPTLTQLPLVFAL